MTVPDAPISGYTKIHNVLTQQYDIEPEDATKALDNYMATERESISDSISDDDVNDLAEIIYSTSKYWD